MLVDMSQIVSTNNYRANYRPQPMNAFNEIPRLFLMLMSEPLCA